MHRFLLFLSLFAALTQSQAGLAEFDAIIAQGEANNDINPIAKLTSPITLDGSSGVPFNFGSTLFDTTIEFIVMGNASAIDVGTLAAGSNTDFELRFAQWNNTGRLGFTHFGNQDYVTTVRSPQVLTHVCYRWDELNTGGSPTVNTMEIYINGHLTQSIVAPDFEMPKGNGFLGGRGPTASHAMAGRIDRVVVHNRAIFPAQIYRHACAFLEQPYQSNHDPISIDYDASESDANPVSQGWVVEEATIPGADNDANGLLDGVANVGLVSGPAWQIYDRRTEDALNAPRYRHAITRPELTALYENGWTFTAKVRAVGVSHATSSFVGWQFRKGLDPGFGVVGSGRVGFHFFESSDGEFVVNPTFKPAVNLGPGSGDQVHTIKAVGRPRSAGFEWFVNDVSQGYLDIRDFPYGDDESIMIGANSSGGLGDGADWFEVSLESNASLGITEEVERIEREVVAHSESIVADGVDAATGAFMRAQDLLTVHGVRTIDFPVYYDSRLTARVGPLGYGWSHPYEARLVCYGSDRVMIHWDAHRTSEFVYDSADSNHRRYFKGVDEDVRYGVLIEHTFEAAFLREIWKLTLLDGTSYGFELGSGRLIYVANSARQYLEMQYDSGGRLVAIKDKASDASISLDYNERGLIANVRDPLGREVLLDYDDQWRLTCLPAPFLLDEDTDYVSAEDVIIPDNQAAGVLIPIPVNTGGVVGLAYIHQLVVLHDRPSDLTFYLRSASGTEVEIPHAETLTEFDLSGFFERNAFDGELRRGDWALRVVDDVPGATGELIGSVILRLSDSFRAICLSYDGPLITAGVDVLGDPLFSNVYDAKAMDAPRHQRPRSAISTKVAV